MVKIIENGLETCKKNFEIDWKLGEKNDINANNWSKINKKSLKIVVNRMKNKQKRVKNTENSHTFCKNHWRLT